jgi:hypothetical protein
MPDKNFVGHFKDDFEGKIDYRAASFIIFWPKTKTSNTRKVRINMGQKD